MKYIKERNSEGDHKGSPLLCHEEDWLMKASIVRAIPCGRPQNCAPGTVLTSANPIRGIVGAIPCGRPALPGTVLKTLYAFLPLLLLTLLLAACGDTVTPSSAIGPIESPTSHTQPTTPAIMAIGNFREYPLPQSDDGLMRPAIDHQGRIWFGEMNRNNLAVLDPHTQKFQQISPPHGLSGIMGVIVASDNTIWFAEQYANYIGHYFPASAQFQTYSLPTLTVPDPNDASKTLTLPSAPNDLVFDKQGNIWFTELNADALGRLDSHTGSIQQYPISTKKSVPSLSPYGVTIDPQGIIWFTEASNSHIGRLDPSTGRISFFTMPGLDKPLMEIASDAHGMLWITSFNSVLLSFNPGSGTFTPYYAPALGGAGGSSGGLYGVTVTPNGQIWVTLAAQNVLARLDVAANRFTYYAIPTTGSLPLGVVVGANNSLWFTEAGSNKIGMLKP